MRIPGTAWYPAHSSNYTKGRNTSIKKFTVHHEGGWSNTLRYLWQNPDRNASSHLWVGNQPGQREQYVDTNDTAWCNSNFASNSESISCEVRGDWRGYYDQTTLDNLTEVMYQCLKAYPNLTINYHNDIKATICPAELKSKGYALDCWNKAKNRIALENMPPQPANLRIDIPDKKVMLIRDSNIWDMSFTSFANAKSLGALPKGTVIDVAGVYDHPLSKSDYYLSNYSWDRGLNNGINQADCKDYTPPVPKPEPTPPPPPVVVPSPPEPPVEGPGPLPPLPVDPNGDLIQRVGALEAIVKRILEFLESIFNRKV